MKPPEERVQTPSEFPDDTARAEPESASTHFEPAIGRRLKRGAKIAGLILLCGFVVVRVVRLADERALVREAAAATAFPPVDVVIAQAGGGTDELVLPGQTVAWNESTVFARVNGYVAKFDADIGDRVTRGQILATIDTPELDAQLAAALAQLGVAEAQRKARAAEVELGRSTHERWRDAPKGVVSDQEREEKKADFDSAVARLGAADAQITLDRARVAQFLALAQFKQVRAPFDGTVTERRIDIGNLTSAGSGATTPLYRISQADPLRVYVELPQSASLDLLRPGTAAQVRTAGTAARVVDGTVARAAQALDAQSRTMRVEVDLANTDHALLPGMYVNVAFRLPAQGLIEVPAATLVFRAGKSQVARVGEDGKVAFRDVVIARDDGLNVLLGSGVSNGDRIVLNISSQIRDGQTVSMSTRTTPSGTASVDQPR